MQQQQQQEAAGATGANVVLQDLTFHPPGAQAPLLSNVSLALPANQLGLIMGRSGSGKTTLMQLLAGLSDQTEGGVYIWRGPLTMAGSNGRSDASAPRLPPGLAPLTIEQRMQQVGLVFQFPERHFLGEDLVTELTFTWPRDLRYWGERQALAVRMQQAVEAVALTDVPMQIPPTALSGGQQRRLALALQLSRRPSLLLLDEPLAGLDWRARAEVVSLLRQLKQQCTLLVVSHDLREISPLVDCAWRMQLGGRLEQVAWPPGSLSDLED